ncbi:MAG TPA: SDR family NAD(P)-dependent oxidoreductase [Polyangia bacterium]|jgi:short-subunit dehydrogenase|nr:SDR family NAD(P)-dependent oxidoreductase [Polyangia bacterium]
MATVANPLAVVTGASTGIGFHLARQAAQRGYDVVIAADGEGIEAAADELRAIGTRVQAVRADLATAEGCQQLIAAVERLARPVEVLALNAGVGVGGQFATETNLDEEIDIIDLNCSATVRLAKWGAKAMAARGRGRILITASLAGIMPTPLQAVYGASKAFTLSFASSLHHELEDFGVTVTAMLPGPTDTEFFHRAGMDDTKVAQEAVKNQPEDVAKQGFDALLAGKERVAAGNFSVKMQGAVARFLPESVKANMHKNMSEHGSAEKK